ncbi:MAG: phosphate ABC transporter permease subunit PstC [Acidobacteria bacterium]|nr:phosphate ABC transporter permease subunit PstC [Acidobacteriota bacterium]
MSPSRSDRTLVFSLGLAAVMAGAAIVLIVTFLLVEAWPALRHLGPDRFLRDGGWLPSAGAEGRFSLVPMLAGTVAVSVGALLLAAPAGVVSAVFCRFYAPSALAPFYRRLIEVLAGIPSVVYGFWGLVVLVPWIHRLEPPGQSLLAGILVLGLMVFPTVALMSEAALKTLPSAYFSGAAALGLGRWATIRGIALPAAAPGIGAGCFLAVARALGETMAVLMVCGNVVQVPATIFEPVRTLTANIALEMAYATRLHRSALFVSGLALMTLVGVLVVVVDRLSPETAHD